MPSTDEAAPAAYDLTSFTGRKKNAERVFFVRNYELNLFTSYVVGAAVVASCGMCWVCWLLSSDWVDCEPELELEPEPDELELLDDDVSGTCGTSIGGRFRRSSGMSGGGTGGCPLIISGPLALLSSVDQPPLPSVAPMLHET